MESERTTYNHRLELRLDGPLKRAVKAAAGDLGVNEWVRQAMRDKLALERAMAEPSVIASLEAMQNRA